MTHDNNLSLTVETAFKRAVIRWPKKVHEALNYADEDLILKLKGATLDSPQLYKVNYLSQKELSLEPGDYRVALLCCPRSRLLISTPLDRSPHVTWIQDSLSFQVLTWGGIDWSDIQREIENIHHIDWEQDTTVALRLCRISLEDGSDTSIEWIPVPNKDHATLEGIFKEIALCVIKTEDNALLKTLFTVKKETSELRPFSPKLLLEASLNIPAGKSHLHLTREVLETDSYHLKATWKLNHPHAAVKTINDLYLTLTQNGIPLPGQERLKVPQEGEWWFYDAQPGVYQAKLYSVQECVAESDTVTLPPRNNTITLMPVDEQRAYCYWYVAPTTWTELEAQHGSLLGRVRCLIKVFHQAPGNQLIWQPDLSPEVDLSQAKDYYLNLPPDQVYAVKITAVIDGDEEVDLTPVSNLCQLGRTVTGTNPIVHKGVSQPTSHPTIRPLRSPHAPSSHSFGQLIVHLHAHLPFIPEPIGFSSIDKWRPQGHPQEWYPEAVRETYLPLLNVFEALVNEGVDFKISMDLSPPLVAMMKSQRHASDILAYLERLIRLARLEVERTSREEPHYLPAASMHLNDLRRCRDLFLSYDGDLAGAFKKFQDLGHLEICTCIGTHPMLPLWTSRPHIIRGQALAAAHYHKEVFKTPSQGVWLPECAYTPGIEPFLEEAGFKYFFSETHAVTLADAPAEFGINAPVYAKGSNLAVFPRDPETGKQVWSGEEGYPGDPNYLEFHIRGGVFKYNRITDRHSGWHKQPYNPAVADMRAADHAGHFMDCRNARFSYLRTTMWKKPLVVAMYDAELFGHHWYEGPRFLYYLFKKLHYDQNRTELTTPSAYLAANPICQDVFPNVSTWGHNGTFEKWMYGHTTWMYRHAHEAADEMAAIASCVGDDPIKHRLAAQAARQLMLAMSSDLPFVISNGHFVDRMKAHFSNYLREFWRLSNQFRLYQEGKEIDLTLLRSLELENCIFPNLDPTWFTLPDSG